MEYRREIGADESSVESSDESSCIGSVVVEERMAIGRASKK
jgi:hypothetical protein